MASKWIRSLSLYTFSSFLAAGVPFLILPILTIYLKPEDYAVISLFSALEKFLMSFIGLGLVETVGVQFFKRSNREFGRYVYMGLILSAVVSALISTLLFYLPDAWLSYIGIPKVWVLLAPAICFMFLIFNIILVVIRSHEKPKQFLVASILVSTVEVLLTLLLVVGLMKGWEGRLLSHLYTAVLVSSGGLLYLALRRHLYPAYDRLDFKIIFLSGLTLIPDGMSVFALELSDRFFISNMVGMKETGFYSVGSTIAMITLLVVRSFINAFYPDVYKSIQLDNLSKKKSIVFKTYLLLVSILFVSLFVSFIVAPIAFKFILSANYAEGLNYVIWISLGYFFLGVYAFFKVYCLQSGKMYLVTITSVFMIGLNLILNYKLIGIYGTIGAAYATCASYLASAMLMLYFGVSSVKMPWLKFLK